MRSLALILGIFLSIVQSVFAADYIPPQAFTYKETIKTELDTLFPNIPNYNYVPALIEHESCISLKHKRCWNPASELLTKREQGLGFFQHTRAFREDGSTRFDVVADMKNKYKETLKEASWDTLKTRPDIQIRMGVLGLRDNFKSLYSVKDENVRLQMTDAAHNTGLGNVNKKRRACALAAGCNPQLWFGHVEKQCIGHTKVLYGNRSACDIVTYHVKDVYKLRMPKYERKYFTAEDRS